jgi:putative transposase
VKVIGRLPGERSCLSLVWAVLDRASRGWRGVQHTIPSIRLLAEIRRELFDPIPIDHDEEVSAETVTPAA